MVANKCFPLEGTLYVLDDEILLLMDIELQQCQKYFIKWILCMRWNFTKYKNFMNNILEDMYLYIWQNYREK